MKNFYTKLLSSTIFLVTAITQVNATEVSIHKNENSGLLTWTMKDEGFQIELIQLLPDFIRAIYAKHKFPEEEVERAASYCVFGTILKNTSEGLSLIAQGLTFNAGDNIVIPAEEFPSNKVVWQVLEFCCFHPVLHQSVSCQNPCQ